MILILNNIPNNNNDNTIHTPFIHLKLHLLYGNYTTPIVTEGAQLVNKIPSFKTFIYSDRLAYIYIYYKTVNIQSFNMNLV